MPIDDEHTVPTSDQETAVPEADGGDLTPGEDALALEALESTAAPDRAPDPDGSPASRPPGEAGGAVSGPDADLPPDEATLTVEDVMETGPAEPVVSEHLVAEIEALVFASPEPITQKQLLKLLNSDPREDVLAALAELEARYEARGGGLQFVQVAGGYQIVTRPELADSVRRMFHERTTQKLSIAALETLAVIAYKQPITAAEITDIRSVNTSGVVGTLLERGLVKISGRKQVVGRPFLYSTTREFLDRFGLKDLTDLPKVEDMAGALGFEVPAGLQTEAVDTLPLAADEAATEEDAAVLSGEGGDELGVDRPADDEQTRGGDGQ
jgi:segregation and condensation protein B